jgi:elongation factor P
MNVPVKRGSMLRHQGHYYIVEDVSERHSGKQRPVVHVALREAMEGRHIDRTLDELDPVQTVEGTYRPMQYLYSHAGGPHGAHVFLDAQSLDEVELPPTAVGSFAPFLRSGEEYTVLFVGEQPLRLDPPPNVALIVADTAAPTHAVGAAGGGVLKEARLDNGLEVRVPLFIKTGDTVRIDTATHEYLGKA